MFRRRPLNAVGPRGAATISSEASGAKTAATPSSRDTSETRRAARVDLFAGIGEATERDLALLRILRDAFALVDEMAKFSSEFGGMAETTLMRADQFVASLCSLKGQSELIEERLVAAGAVVAQAHARSNSALDSVAELTKVIGEIERVAKMIASIATQTNLLALNATIEAARAGTAGASFRVVAGEVKLLSQQTERATQDIVDLVKRIQSRVQTNVVEVKDFDRVIDSLQDMFTAVRAAIEAQGDQTRDIAIGSEEVAALAQQVRTNAARLQQLGDSVTSMTKAAGTAADQARGARMNLSDRAVIVLGHGSVDDRDVNLRWPVSFAGVVTLRGQAYPIRVIDLSVDAMQIETGQEFPAWALGEAMVVDLPELGAVSLRLLSPTTAGFETVVVDSSAELRRRIAEKVAALHLAYRPYIERVQEVAVRAAKCIEQTISAGELTPEILFDASYRREGETEPALYTTPAVTPLVAATQALLEAELDRLPVPDFCFLQDRNGFNPVHNLHYSNPRSSSDVIWNLRHSRMQRIFGDRVGMAAGRNLRSFLVQSYARDMGDTIETLMEFDAPIFVQNRHWGAVRMAFRLGDRLDGWLPVQEGANGPGAELVGLRRGQVQIVDREASATNRPQ